MRSIKAVRAFMVSGVAVALAGCSYFAADTPSPIVPTTPVGGPMQDDANLLADARRFFESGESGLALGRVETYLERNPASPSAHNLAGAILDSLGRYDLAEQHYKKALALQTDYLPAINNFGLSKLQRGRANSRIDLEQEADALLARAEALSADPAQLLKAHDEFRAGLPAPHPVMQIVQANPARLQQFAWLERRSANYTFVVTHGSAEMAAAFDLDPAIAFVSPGAMSTTMRIALAPVSVRLQVQPTGSPFLLASGQGFSRLTLRPRKALWYKSFAGGCSTQVQPSPCATGSLPASDARADIVLKTHTTSLLKIAAVQ